MSEASQTSSAPVEETVEEGTENNRLKNWLLGTSLAGFVIRGTMIPILFYVLIFVFGFWRAWVDPDGSAAYFEYVRGLFEMVASIASVVIVIAIGVLVLQIARFVNLLYSEIKPITEDTKQAIQNVRATSEFVQKNAVKPVISIHAFVSGLIAFLRELSYISRILQRRNETIQENETPDT